MHEMGIVQSIIEILEQQVQIHNAKRIVKVSLEFGALTAVLPSAVTFAFDVLSKGTVAEGAMLDIKIIPLKLKCNDCGLEVEIENYDPFCSNCKSSRTEIIQGRDEMRIASLEVEDN
jgi:hydrogenase nickel incorporation protein HypA/HybF